MIRKTGIKSGIAGLSVCFSSKYAIITVLTGLIKTFLIFYSTSFIAAAGHFSAPAVYIILSAGICVSLYMLIKYLYPIFWIIKYSGLTAEFGENGIKISVKDSSLSGKPGQDAEMMSVFRDFIYIDFKPGKLIIPLYSFKKEYRKKISSALETDFLPGDHLLHFMFDSGRAFLIAFTVALHITHYFAGKYFIPTLSMQQTLTRGDRVLAEKISYGITVPKMFFMDSALKIKPGFIRGIKRGDIVIFKPLSPGDETRDYVKRCIAVAGDNLEIREDGVYINGARTEEPYAFGKTNYDIYEDGKINGTVPEGMIAVLGDNREDSRDSRYFGYVPATRVEARAFMVFWNSSDIKNLDFSRIGFLK